MNPGPLEEGGKVATSVVQGLTSQPLALALIVVNCLFLALFVWIAHEVSVTNRIERAQRTEMLDELRKTCETCRDRLQAPAPR